MDLTAPVGREDVPAVLDPDQVIGPVAADPFVADGVGGTVGARGLGRGRDAAEQHDEGDDGAGNALTAFYPRHGNGVSPLSLP